MSAQTVKSHAREARVLGALADGPLSVREIGVKLRREVWAAWSERHGYDFEWDSDEEPLGARILAKMEAEENGLAYLFSCEIYPVLVRLERKGCVERIQIAGRRPMLWRAVSGVER